jgi:hypothetical protein
MTSESENKLLARRFMEEMVNPGAADRLSDFLAPEYVAPHLGIAGIEQAREHLLTKALTDGNQIRKKPEVRSGNIRHHTAHPASSLPISIP